ncbi:MAG: hypothetical protein CMJ36_00190 [Phycisphaerae bacterium]|nr:hypothetical protein [Phycisphaerae bacterium]
MDRGIPGAPGSSSRMNQPPEWDGTRMKIQDHRICLTLSAIVVMGITGAGVSSQGSGSWSDDVWEASIDGDRNRLETLLTEAPELEGALYESYRARLEDWGQHRIDNQEFIKTRRSETHEQLVAALEENNLLDALRLAVEYQTLSDDFDASLEEPSVKEAIDRSEKALPDIIADRDWLYAQEVLLRLRTLYEDTSLHDRYEAFDRRMEGNGQRIVLLRRYARERLYELYVKRNERLGEEPPDRFNESLADRWKQEVEGIDRDMVVEALETSVDEHISDSGWEPIYEGGFDALEVLTNTHSLSGTFPGMADDPLLASWHDGLATLEAEVEAQVEAGRAPHRVAGYCFDALDTLNDKTIDLPDSVLWREFGDGALRPLDPYTSIIWPYDITEFNRQMEGKFIGVGIMISESEIGDIKVVYPLEGKPAYQSGVLPDDIILEVDGQSTAGWTVQDAVHHITGPRYTNVTLGISREGREELLEIPVTRDLIKMHSVKGWRKTGRTDSGDPEWDWYIDQDNRIGYVKLTQFNEDTYTDLRDAIGEMRDEGEPRGLILDLRFNPGGLLTSAYQISDMFVSEGRILSGEDKLGRESFVLDSHRHNTFLGDIPTVVLINQGSASASEIVSGCIQAHEAGVVFGERSFGKGSVQTVHQVTQDSKLKCTTQYYRLPEGVTGIEGRLVDKEFSELDWGVAPDIEIEMSPDQIEKSLSLRLKADRLPGDPLPAGPEGLDEEGEEKPDVDELLSRGLDPQLELAVLVLQARCLSDSVAGMPQAKLDED